MKKKSVPIFVSLFLIPLMFVACSGHSSSTVSPTTPSAPGAAPAPAPASNSGATITGTVMGGTSSTSSFRPTATGLTVTVSGTSITATVDASGRFVLQGVPAGTIELRFTGASADARLSLDGVTEREDIHITIIVNGTIVEVEDNHREATDNRVEIEGRITALNAASRMVTVAGVVVTIPSTVAIRSGATTVQFSQLQVGDRLKIHASKSASGVTATEVEAKTGSNGGPGTGNDSMQVELEGTMTGKSGTCPAITFTVNSQQVTTNSSTQFKDTTCAALANNDRVEVKATKQTSGPMLATRVEKKNAAAAEVEVELEGTMSAKAGTCPAITFMVSSKQVTTNSATQFKDTTCAALANNDRVEVEATMQTNGTLLATKVEKKGGGNPGGNNDEKVELEGSLSSKTGSCPAITFTVNSKQVSTNSATEFRDTTCQNLANNDRVEVKATKQTNGSLLATRVEKKK